MPWRLTRGGFIFFVVDICVAQLCGQVKLIHLDIWTSFAGLSQ